MDTYSVLLLTYTKLPFLELGPEVADLLDVLPADALMALRHQKGDVWHSLPQIKAKALAEFLTAKGYPCVAVAQNEFVQTGSIFNSERADISGDTIEFFDLYNNMRVVSDSNVELALVVWSLEEIEGVGGRDTDPLRGLKLYSRYSDVRRKAYLKRKTIEEEPIGWVLQIFSIGPTPSCIRVNARGFNYCYQDRTDGIWKDRFGLLLIDLAAILDLDKLDDGFKYALQNPLKPLDEFKCETNKEMLDRAMYELTIRRIRTSNHPAV
jgi:hypothetical protein